MYKKRANPGKRRLFKALADTRKVLLFLAEQASRGCEAVYDSYWLRSAFIKGGSEYAAAVKRGLERKELRRALYGLKRRGFIKTDRMAGRILCSLTHKGREAGLVEQVRVADDHPKGCLCLVSFDIPERARHLRGRFRRFLKDCGFIFRQKSLWFSRKDVAGSMRSYVTEIGASQWVLVFKATDPENR